MKTIIAGSRTFMDYKLLLSKVDHYRKDHEITEIVSGGADGADHMGELYAHSNGITLKVFPADWKTHGRAAGPIRNKQMADYADCLIAVWDGQSKGTKNMIETMHKQKKPVYIVWIGQPFTANLAAGEELHSDKGYSIGTEEKYLEFVKKRNERTN